MSFLMEHYELTVNLDVLYVCVFFGNAKFCILLCFWDWDRVKVSSIIYMFLGNESGGGSVFFSIILLSITGLRVVPMCVFLHIKCNNIVSYMINWQ